MLILEITDWDYLIECRSAQIIKMNTTILAHNCVFRAAAILPTIYLCLDNSSERILL